MLKFSSVISTELDNLKRWLIKVRINGKSDIQTPKQANPFGIDSNPINGMVAVYGPTTEMGKNVIVGYLNPDQVTAPGETRLFSVDENGNLKTYVWVKNDGDILLGGDADNLVRYTPLNTTLQNFKTFLQQELIEIAAGISAAGGSYTPGTVTIDISNSKVDKVKVP